MIKKIYSAVIFFSLSLSSALAAGSIGGSLPNTTQKSQIFTMPNPLGVGTIPELINRIIDYIIIFGAAILTLIILWSAFQILTAAGDEEKFKTGVKTIKYAVIGYMVILISKGIILVIQEVLGS